MRQAVSLCTYDIFPPEISLKSQAIALEEIGKMDRKINSLAPNSASKEIATNQGSLDLGIHQETEIAGVGMGVLSDGYHDPRPVRPVEYRERETPKITQQASDFDADY